MPAAAPTDDENLQGDILTEREKLKIRLEESYRREVASGAGPKRRIGSEDALKILQGLAIIIGIWATYNEFRKAADEARTAEADRHHQAAREYRKYFYQKQFDLYGEAVEAAAILSTEDMETDDYKATRKAFYRLFWGKLSIVEDKTVEKSMMRFKTTLEDYENEESTTSQRDLEQASLALAHDARAYTLDVWIDKSERENYNR